MGSARGVVIVGAGLGGVKTAEQLRECGYDGPVTLVGEETEPPYDRPPLSKHVLRGERDVVPLRPPGSYDDLGVELRLGRRATALDPDLRVVTLDDGTRLPYDACVLAPGATPRTLPAPPEARVHVLRTAQDARWLRENAQAARRGVVVGGGFLGCEVAASLRSLGVDVTLVELASAPLQPVLGDVVAAYVAALHTDAGVALEVGVAVDALAADGVRLSDGRTLPADLVVVALGVRPVVDLAVASGLDVADGISCDERGRTSAAGILAVGDAAGWLDARSGARRRIEHWTTTVEHAGVVARVIMGADDVAPPGVPYFWTDQYRVKIQSLGRPSREAEVVVVERSETKRIALYAEGGILTAVVGFASPAAVMRMRALLAEPTPFEVAVDHARRG